MALNAGDIKRQNRQHIFELLIHYGRTTKTELAGRSGLSNPTIYNIITEMEERGLIEHVEENAVSLTPGRPREYLQLNGNSRYAFGVRYEGELLCVGLINLCGCIRAVRIRRVEGSAQENLTKKLPEMIEEILSDTGVDRQRVLGMGIGIAPWIKYEKAWIQEAEVRTGLRAVVGSDVHFAVAGEYVNQKQRVKNMLFVNMGTSVSCGVMVDGHVQVGSAGQLGRIGNMIMEDGKTLDELIGRKALREKFGALPEYDRVGASAYAVRYLAIALHNLLLGCDIQTIVLGGDVPVRLGECVVDVLRQELEKLTEVSIHVRRQSCPTPAIFGAAFSVVYEALDEIIGTDE